MKKLFTTMLLLLFCHLSYSQVPSINENTNAAKVNKSQNIKDLEVQINKLKEEKKEIESDKFLKSASTSLTKDEKKTIKNQLNSKDKEIQSSKKSIRRLMAASTDFDATFPTMNKNYRPRFFKEMYNNEEGKTSYVNAFVLAADENGALVQSEIITDNMSALRVAFGTIVTAPSTTSEETTAVEEKASEENSETETEQDALKRLINGGGNFYLELILPVLTTNQDNGDQVTAYVYASSRGAMDIKGFGNNIDTSTGNLATGLNGYLGVSSDSKKFNFFVYGNLNYTFGSDEFYKNLGLNNEKAFVNGKIILGVTLLNRFKISALVNSLGSDEKLRSGKVLIGVQILPGF